MSESKIKKLPQEAIGLLQSGIVITDAVQCILELVYNSLDAKATTIVIRIDIEKYKIQVTDNGLGMSKVDLDNFGEKYMTSKYKSYCHGVGFTTYGFKGQAISSLLEVCKTLKVETKTKEDESVLIKIFKNKISLPILSRKKNIGVGTTITVEDFMCSMPVRRKRINEIFDIEEIKTQLKYLAVVHYKVSFSLKNENKTAIVFQIPSTSSFRSSVKNIFGRFITKHMKDIQQKYKSFQISGLVSRKYQLSTKLQLIYVNKRLITKGVIHKVGVDIINKYMRKSHFLSPDSSAEVFTTKKFKNFSGNMYILEINCPTSNYELFTNMRKCTVEFTAWKDVLKALNLAIRKAFSFDITNNSFQTYKGSVNEKKESKKIKNKRGTSLLLNAIKGVLVKRYSTTNRNSKINEENTIIKNKNKDIFTMKSKRLFNKIKNSNIKMNDQENRLTERKIFGKKFSCLDQTCDSLESPIPKKRLKSHLNNEFIFPPKLDLNGNIFENPDQFFFQFYKWLKIKFESDTIELSSKFWQLKEKEDNFKFKGLTTPKSYFLNHDKTFKRKTINLYEKKVDITDDNFKFVRSHLLNSESKNTSAPIKKKAESFEFEKFEITPHSREDVKDIFKYFFSAKNNSTKNNKNLEKATGCVEDNSCLVADTKAPQSVKKQNYLAMRQKLTLSADESDEFFSNCLNFRNFADSFECHSLLNNKQLVFSANYLETWTSHNQKSSMRNEKFHRSSKENKEFVSSIEKRLMNKFTDVEKTQSDNDLEFGCRTADSLEGYLESTDSNHSFNLGLQVIERKNKSKKNMSLSAKDALMQFKVFDAPKMLEISGLVGNQDNEKNCMLSNVKSIPNKDKCRSSSIQATRKSKKKETLIPKTRVFIPDDQKNSDQYICCCQKAKTTSENINDEALGANNGNDGNSGNSVLSKGIVSEIWSDCLSRLKKPSMASSNINKQNSPLRTKNPDLTQTIAIENIDLGSLDSETPKFHLTSRLNCIPKGLSPVMPVLNSLGVGRLSPNKKTELKSAVESKQGEEYLTYIKWQNSSPGGSLKPTILEEILDEIRQKSKRNLVDCKSGIPSNPLSCCAIKVHNLLHSFSFTKNLLSKVEIIGQLDKKFIVAKMEVSVPQKKELITLFDQHAVDERIRLEKIINENTLSDGKILCTTLNPAMVCEINESFLHIVSTSNDKLLHFGLGCKAIDEKSILVQKIPNYIAKKYLNNGDYKSYDSLKKFIIDLITDAVNELTDTRGALSQIPKILYNLFCSEACHSAIKFNKVLSIEDMLNMVSKLKNCTLPFQCAHGRPSVIPIIDLKDLSDLMAANAKAESINYKKFKNFINEKKETNICKSEKTKKF